MENPNEKKTKLFLLSFPALINIPSNFKDMKIEIKLTTDTKKAYSPNSLGKYTLVKIGEAKIGIICDIPAPKINLIKLFIGQSF